MSFSTPFSVALFSTFLGRGTDSYLLIIEKLGSQQHFSPEPIKKTGQLAHGIFIMRVNMVAQIDFCKSTLLLLDSQESSIESYLILCTGYGLMGIISFGYMQWSLQRFKKTLHVYIKLVPHLKKCICIFIGIAHA